MKSILLLWFAVAVAIVLTSCKNEETKIDDEMKNIQLEDFFKNPEKSAYQISPNGEFLAFMAPYKNRMNIFVQKVEDTTTTRLTASVDRDIAGYFWANENRIVYMKDIGGDENYKLFGVNLDGTDSICYTCFDGVRSQVIDPLIDIPDEMLIGMNKRNPQVFDVYRLHLSSGEMEMIAENPGNIQGWITDHEGKLRLATAIVDGVNEQVLYRETENSDWQVLVTTSFKDSFSPYFFTFDNKNIYVISNIGRDKTAFIEYNIKTREENVLFENDEYDLSGVSYSRKRKVLTYASYTSWKRQMHFFDDEYKKIYTSLSDKLPDYEIAITSRDLNENVFIVRTYSDKTRGAYYLYIENTDELTKLADLSPWLDEAKMANQLPVEFTSRDGLNLHGYLTLPADFTMETAKNLPAIINVHGGPWARDNWGFNPEVQFLANRGYAVLQINFRGSTGYGKEFWQASFKQWGQTMQDDITDGTNWLIEKGIANPDKIAIYGGSYGGYATLMGIVKEPDLYCCAVDYVGVSNMFTFMKTVPPYWEPMLKMMYEMVGDPEKDSVMMKEVSPVFHVDKIKTPLFIAQGANDPRVNIDESDQVVAALKDRNVDVLYLVKDDEGHGFHNEENRFDFYRTMENFLSQHMK
ncbi:MAG: S9 family peptidase [Bacteroidales bacterium]|nr:S9 family peptidase [Bacteroidales bacterium]